VNSSAPACPADPSRPPPPVPRAAPALVSLVFPVYNEAETLPHLRAAVTAWRRSFPHAVEIVLVDDGSRDASWALMRAWAEADAAVRAVALSRNFGHQLALTAGLAQARGDAVVVLDADLQDPLEVIAAMVERYQAGYDVVYGRRCRRLGEGLLKRGTAWLFYRVMRLLVDPGLPADTGDFRLVSRRCVEALKAMPEGHRFLRGMFAWVGFHQTAVEYVRPARVHGETKFPLLRMLAFAGSAVLSFSPLPIRLIGLLGLVLAALGFGYGGYVVARWYWVGDTVEGWPTLVVLLSVIGGMILVSLGVLGEYLSRIYEAVKQRPLYLVREVYGQLREEADR